jgi:hypothetical protein
MLSVPGNSLIFESIVPRETLRSHIRFCCVSLKFLIIFLVGWMIIDDGNDGESSHGIF